MQRQDAGRISKISQEGGCEALNKGEGGINICSWAGILQKI